MMVIAALAAGHDECVLYRKKKKNESSIATCEKIYVPSIKWPFFSGTRIKLKWFQPPEAAATALI